MADPVSIMAIVSLVGTAIGGGVSAYGAYEGGKTTQAMNNYRARVAQINADLMGNNAIAAQVSGGLQAERSGFATGQRIGLTRVGMAAGGVDIGSGTPKNLVGSEAEVGQFEQASIRSDAERRAFGFQTQQFGFESEAGLETAAGKAAVTAADITAGSSLLGGATSVSDKWVKYSQVGGPFGSAPPPPSIGG